MNNKYSNHIPDLAVLPGPLIEKIIDSLTNLTEKVESLQNDKLQDEYLTAQEFMDKTKMSRATFDELRSRNEIPCGVIKRGRKVFVKAIAVKQYFEGK